MLAAEGSAPAVDIGRIMDEGSMSRLQIRIVGLCCITTFLDGYDTQALGLVVPHLAEQWSLNPGAFAIALSASLVGIALGAVLLAPLADRLGRRPTLIAMMLLVGFSTLGAAFANNAAALSSWRLLTGLGLGASIPVATALTSEYAPTRKRASLVAMMIAFGALGSFASGLVAPVFIHAWGWRGVFAIGAVSPIAVALLMLLWLPESLRYLVVRNLNPASVAAQLRAISPQSCGKRPFYPAATTVVRASVLTLFSSRYWFRTTLVWIIFWFNLFVIYSLISWTPTLLHSAAWTHAAAQRASGLIPLGGIIGGLTVAWIADRGYAIPALLCAYVGGAMILVLFSIAPGSPLVWIALLLLSGAGVIGGQMGAASVASAYYYPPELRSTGVGWFNGFGRLGSIAGPLILGGLISSGWPAEHILTAMAVPMLICAASVCFLPYALR
jgi:AAHS family 4-hydroxybenzoate transporter-like MFS transporter